MRAIIAFLLLPTTLTVWSCTSGGITPVTGSRDISLNFTNLEDVGDQHTYRAWLQDGPTLIPVGNFDIDASGNPMPATLSVSEQVFRGTEAVVISIEQAGSPSLQPSAQRILAGEIQGSAADLSVADRRSLGDPFTGVGAQYVLETRTTPQTGDYAQGIYWCVPGVIFDIPEPVLPEDPNLDITLPELPAGWVYEGWVVTDGQPVSTGRITTPMAPDSDGLGPAAGPVQGLPFPGQEFISPPMTLPGGQAMLTVEPEPDYSPAPSPLTVLLDPLIEDRGPATLQWTENRAAQTRPSGTATFTLAAE